jgi:O-antigen/teichoic acid export membrane protein
MQIQVPIHRKPLGGQELLTLLTSENNMGKNRLEAVSDGVIAVITTILVLELKVPHGGDFGVLIPLWSVFMSYVMSFIYVGIYWKKLQYASYPSKRSFYFRLCNGALPWEPLAWQSTYGAGLMK